MAAGLWPLGGQSVLWMGACLVALLFRQGGAQGPVNTVRVLSSPGKCYGGQPCQTQPSVNVYDAQGNLDLGFTGYAYIVVYAAPGSKSIYLGTCSGLDTSCSTATEIVGNYGRVNFQHGLAQFQNVMFKVAGSGYQLKFVGSVNGNDFSYALSAPFEVHVGEPFRLQFATFIGAAFGGQPFLPNPVIAIVDRGGNQVSISTGKVSAALTMSPTGNEKLSTLDTFDAYFSSGVASYTGLYLNLAGGPYAVMFMSDIVINADGVKRTLSIMSKDFNVAVGAPSALIFDPATLISSAPVYAGEFFQVTPRLLIKDAGGNTIISDSSSGVQVAIHENPAKATIGPAIYLFAVSKTGIVTFTSFVIDKAASGFILSFTLSTFSSIDNSFTPTSVVLLSERFSVNTGPPRQLVTSVNGDNSWAGGQPMGTQPVVVVQDYGSNTLFQDFSSNVTCTMVSSLSTTRTIVIETTASDYTFLKSVDANVESGVYGTGHTLIVNVHFNYEVWVLTQHVPTLLLDISNPLGKPSIARMSGLHSQTKTLSFQYTVAANDSSNALDYIGMNALNLNGALIVNGNNRTARTTLPVHGIRRNATIVIKTTKPYITSISSSSLGSFSVGDVIVFNVTFSAKIAVTGIPFITTTMVNGHGSNAVAKFSSTSPDRKSAMFDYVVGFGESSSDLSIQNVVVPAGAQILLYSDNPQTQANTTISAAQATLFKARHSIVIDTAAPQLLVSYGCKPSTNRKIGYAGDSITFTMQFDKKVTIQGGFTVALNTGTLVSGEALFTELLSDEKTIQFTYVVARGVSVAALDLKGVSLALAPNSYIRRSTMTPTLNANLSTSLVFLSSKSLRSAGIAIHGEETIIESVTLNRTSTYNPSVLRAGDFVYIRVVFSTPVVISCEPVIVMAVNSTVTRYATYVAGENWPANTAMFKYTVQLGDNYVAGIRYRYNPNAFCLDHGCPFLTSCTILAKSDSPTYPVNIIMPPHYDDPLGVQISPINIDAGLAGKDTHTKITSIACTSAPGDYGAGNFLTFAVKFNDEVVVTYPSFLKLYMNTNSFAEYSSGSGTNTLTFTYSTTVTDSVAALYPMKSSGPYNTPVNCTLPCKMVNRLKGFVNVTNPPISKNSGVVLNPAPPHITSVWSDKPVSPYDGIYTVGEIINIYVTFDMVVAVASLNLRLAVDVGGPQRFAVYSTSSGDTLTFQYIVAAGDYSTNLKFTGSALDTMNGRGQIYRAATAQVTSVNYTLPAPQPLIVSGNLIIKTQETPFVRYVSAVSPSGVYFGGDRIIFKVVFSHYLVLDGLAVINMNLGGHIVQAQFSGTNSTSFPLLPTLPSNPSKEFYFQFEVSPGDFTAALDYTDSFSFSLGKTYIGAPGTLFQASSTPSVKCNLDLPRPGLKGSLSRSAIIRVDGGVPHISSLGFVSAAGTYGSGQEVVIQMTFSMNVVVTGAPLIILETGAIKRLAVFKGLSGTRTLLFSYIAQPGDSTNALDYTSNRAKLQSAVDSFQLNGGTIRAQARHPIVDAQVYLNPPGGQLLGTSTMVAAAGFFRFLDLRIIQRGPDYQLRFSTSPPAAHHTISTTQTIFVSFSNEFELRPNEAQIEDMIGSSVAISGTLAVTGAPSSNRSVTSIQTVTTSGARVKPTPEIQLLGVDVRPQPAIVSFHTTAAVGATVGGDFTITYGDGKSAKVQGPTRPIPADVSDIMLKIMLEEAIGDFGNVTVHREPYIFCACNNAFLWTLTFNRINVGVLAPLIIDATFLTGSNVAFVGPKTLQSAAFLAGTFALKANGKISRDVPFNANADLISAALGDLEYSTIHVEPVPADKSGARSWIITFNHYKGAYEIPLLQSDSSHLIGGNASVWHSLYRKGLHGPGGLNGGFYLEWRGNTTKFLPFNADALTVKNALEALPVVQTVNVQRSAPSSINGFVWTIEFVSVLVATPRGYQLQPTQNLEPIIPHNALNGTQTEVVVGSLFSAFSESRLSGAERRGSFGKRAGAAYIFQKVGEGWGQVATLVGNDTKEFDFFGSSVAIKGNLVVVGAMGASLSGVYDKQELLCSAASGSFRISFRGWTTGLIDRSVTRQGLVDALISAPGDDPKLGPIATLTIDDWGGGALCDNRRAVITFLNPLPQSNGDAYVPMERLTASNVSLTSPRGQAILNVTVIQKGTLSPDGMHSLPQSTGAAYVFRTTCLSATCVRTWTQEAQLFPMAASGGERFGYSVSTTGTVIVIGAPGSYREMGSAYVFDYCQRDGAQSSSWRVLQEISYPHSNSTKDYFGASVAINVNGDIIVVGAPAFLGAGAVFVFKRFGLDCTGNKYAITQILYPHLVLYPLHVGDLYGRSVAISGNYIIAGCPQRDESTIYFGNTKNAATTDTGAAFVFSRKTSTDDFLFAQALEPSNIRRGDRFGWSVALDGSIATVGSLEDYSGLLNASKAIIEVRTKAAYNAQAVGSTFRLMWRASNTTGHLDFPMTRDISANATALEMKAILEADLKTGSLLVSRSDADVYDNGYSWLITFVEQTEPVSPLYADATLLTGTNASVDVGFVNYSPSELRGKTHVFLNTGTGFVEEAFLAPFSHQPIDRCGSAVAISGNYAIVGCPNRDSAVPNHNSGAASIYYLSLLHIGFSKPKSSVLEGNTFTMTIQRDAADTYGLVVDTLFYVETLDRNAKPKNQQFVAGLYGISSSSLKTGQTVFDLAGISGTAIGRASYYGSVHNDSAWVLGMYDYRAISDYVPVHNPRAYLVEYENLTDYVVTTDDTIFEGPDENVTISIHAPGVWPSVLGKLWSVLTIVDDGDGVVNGESQYDKLYQSSAVSGSHLGSSVSVYDAFGVMVAGSPDGFLVHADGTKSQTGLAIIYGNIQGHYVQKYTLYSPNNSFVSGGRFGDDVIVKRGFEKSDCIIVIGEPNQARVHIYLSNDQGSTFTFDTTVTTSEATMGQHQFGAKGTLGLAGNILVIGAPGLEAIFLVYRRYVSGHWIWSTPSMLRSSDFDYDIMYGVIKLHRQYFGTSVAVSGRSIAIGAPFADYDKLGTHLPESNWDTEGSDIFGYGRGRAYTFYSKPAEQVFTLVAPSQLTRGGFKLGYSHLGRDEITSELPFSLSADGLTAALQGLQSIDSVAVTTAAGPTPDGGYRYTWTVTFLTDWQDPAHLVPLWNGPVGRNTSYGCSACVAFSDYMSDASKQMVSNKTAFIQPITQTQSLSASDKKSGSRFGSAIAMDGDQIVVGSTYSGSITSTSWDFEAGTLAGWGRTGSAFDNQPTFGDNSYMRPVSPDPSYAIRMVSEHSNVRGNYYIGTYELRPGSASNFLIADPNYGQGSYQGDAPVGTLTSEVFIIYGTTISFLIGGGCDVYTVYVELLIDGFSVAKMTGQCSERMELASFNVSNYQNRAGQIRIVDASSSNWGHINVDDFQFDWDVSGAVYINTNTKPVVGGNLETPRSGVVYAFLRHINGSDDLCGFDKLACAWTEEAKLMASDKRANFYFGSSLSVIDSAGIVAIGSPGASYTGFYKETQSEYPYQNSTGGDVTSLAFPIDPQYADYFQSDPFLIPEGSGAPGVWRSEFDAAFSPSNAPWEESGAVYVFTKNHAVAINGHVSITQHWPYTEHARVQAPDAYGLDNFGTSVALDGDSLVVGSIGNDGIQPDAGAVYFFKAGFAALYFATEEFSALEGTDSLASVTVMRKLETYSGEIVLEYATSDLTASGVDASKFTDCFQNIPTNLRGAAGCGDYQLTRGIMVIPAHTASGGFKIPIMNNLCLTRFPRYIQVTISVPGSAGLQGESVSARVRIDDDDFIQKPC